MALEQSFFFLIICLSFAGLSAVYSFDRWLMDSIKNRYVSLRGIISGFARLTCWGFNVQTKYKICGQFCQTHALTCHTYVRIMLIMYVCDNRLNSVISYNIIKSKSFDMFHVVPPVEVPTADDMRKVKTNIYKISQDLVY